MKFLAAIVIILLSVFIIEILAKNYIPEILTYDELKKKNAILEYKAGDHFFIFIDKTMKFLGKIPIDIDLRTAADTGMPLVEKNSNHKISKIFVEIASKIKKSFI